MQTSYLFGENYSMKNALKLQRASGVLAISFKVSDSDKLDSQPFRKWIICLYCSLNNSIKCVQADQ